MSHKILKFLSNKFEILQNLGIADKETSKERYIDVVHKILQEQEEKNLVTDKKIRYNDKIVNIEYLGDMETIDISVTGDSLFYCNGILTKNSIGLAATCDVICSLWQEPEDKELGIMNMGMQKNRFGPNFGTGAFKCNYNTLTLKETNPDFFMDDNPSTDNVVRSVDDALNKLSDE
jgi:hypothetical protein